MTGKIIGALLIISGCGIFGCSAAADWRKENSEIKSLIGALDYMHCELRYRLTPLPDLCRLAAAEQKGLVERFLRELAQELESHISPNVSCCTVMVLDSLGPIPGNLRKLLDILGNNLGKFDAEGQLKSLEYVKSYCQEEVEKMNVNRELRLRGYQTLSLCAGAALAILFV